MIGSVITAGRRLQRIHEEYYLGIDRGQKTEKRPMTFSTSPRRMKMAKVATMNSYSEFIVGFQI
jgi:hypothetical protein